MTFDFVIETERLILKCLDFCDAEHLFRLRSDPDYAELFGWDPYKNIEQAYNRIQSCRDDSFCYVFSIVPKIVGYTVGGISLWNIDYDKKIAEIGYDLEKEYRGKGYAFEACIEVLQFAFNQLKMETVTAFPNIKNHPSIALLKKLGFDQKGIIKTTLHSEKESEHYDFRLKK